MNKILVYRTHIEILDYTLGDVPWIERQYSLYDRIYHRAYPKGMVYDEQNKKLYLPRCTNINRLETSFMSGAVIDYSCDPRRQIPLIGLKYTPRDNTQVEAIKFMLAKDRYRSNETKTMLSVNLNTGKGKSYCAIATIAYRGMATAIITDSKGCLDQWRGYFNEYTDLSDRFICSVTGSASIAKLLSSEPRHMVYLISHDTIRSYANTNGWDAVHTLFIHLGIGIKIYDEAHLDFDNMMLIDCHTNTFITYYLTATLSRSMPEEDRIFSIYFSGVPKIDLFDEDVDPHTAYVGIKYNSNPSPMDISNCLGQYGLKRSTYTDYLVQQPNFEYMLYIITDMAIKKPGKSLWYIGTNRSIIYVRDWLYAHYPILIGNVGIYTTLTPKEMKQNELNKKIILSTTKSAGAAMDIKGLVETVNLAEPFRSKVLAQQTFGRTRGDDTVYKDIVDTAFSQTRAYYNYKKPVFSKYATECKEVILRNNELKERGEAIKEKQANLRPAIIFEDDRDKYLPPKGDE